MEAIDLLDLRTEVSEDDDCRLVVSYKEGTDKKFEMIEPCLVTDGSQSRAAIESNWTHFGSSTSKSRIMRSVTSGR